MSIVCENGQVTRRALRTSTSGAAAVALALVVAACSNATATTTTAEPPRTTTTTIAPSTTTTTVPATTTTVYSGPPTLAPGATLPIPDYPPGPGEVDPDVFVGEIEIPAIMLESPMYHGVTDATLDRGVGWWPNTARPGEVGNVVLGGHRTSWPKPFRYVDLLEPGDEIVFTTEAGRFVYAVSRTEVVYPDAMWIVDQTPSATATLFACHPLGSTKQRIVIFADYVRQDV